MTRDWHDFVGGGKCFAPACLFTAGQNAYSQKQLFLGKFRGGFRVFTGFIFENLICLAIFTKIEKYILQIELIPF